MKKIAGEDGAGAGARESENQTHDRKKDDEAGSPAKLRAVHHAEQNAGNEDTGQNAKGSGHQGIEITAEDGLFHEGSHEDSHGHEEQSALLILEKVFHGDFVGGMDLGTGKRDEKGESRAGEEKDPRA